MKKKLWLLLQILIIANITFASTMTKNGGPILFRFRNPDAIVVKVKDMPGDGYISIYNDSRGTTGRPSDDVIVTCDNEPPFVVEENQTRYCFDATSTVTVALPPELFKYGSSGIIMRRLVG